MAILGLCFVPASSVLGDIVHDESVNGDLSGDNLAPTILNADFVNNEIFGSTTFDPLDRDFFTITVDPGFQLSQIVLQLYDTIEDQSFMAVEAGNVVSSTVNTANLLGSALIGASAGAQQGDNILDDLGNAGLGGAGFVGPLGAGTYSFWYQETGADTNYQFNFVIEAVNVPEPSTCTLLLGGVCGMALRRRRNS